MYVTPKQLNDYLEQVNQAFAKTNAKVTALEIKVAALAQKEVKVKK